MMPVRACTKGDQIIKLCAATQQMLALHAGLTPRGITELFNILDRDSGKYTFSVSCYMLELYQDDLADLLLPPQPKSGPQKVILTTHNPLSADQALLMCAC